MKAGGELALISLILFSSLAYFQISFASFNYPWNSFLGATMSPILSVSTKIEIAASPAVVRSVFLDFARYTQWQPGWNIQPADSSKQPLDLKAGDSLKVNMNGNVHHPVVVENSPESFQWEGSLFGLAKGVHQFHFTPSETNPGSTTFTQGEDFRGLLITLSSPWWSSKKFDLGPWDKFNADLKTEVEKSSK